MPFSHRFLGTPFLNFLINLLFKTKIKDSQSGFRVLSKKTFQKLNLVTNNMEFASEMIIKAKRKGIKMIEVPIQYRCRQGCSKLKPYKDGWGHLKYIILEAPFSFYFIISLLLFLTGFAGFLFNSESATLKLLFPILGVQILFLGLFAKTYLHVKFNQPNKVLKRFYSIFNLKIAILIGFILILIPFILNLINLGKNIFDFLLVSTIVGIQIIFNSITLSELSIK